MIRIYLLTSLYLEENNLNSIRTDWPNIESDSKTFIRFIFNYAKL